MIIDTMTSSEVLKEMTNAYDSKIGPAILNISQRKSWKKKNVKVYLGDYSMICNGSRYFYGTSGILNNKNIVAVFLEYLYSICNDSNGTRTVYSLVKDNHNNRDIIYVFSEHFFLRVIERLDIDKSFSDTIKMYMKNIVQNSTALYLLSDEPDGRIKIADYTEIGIGLGYMSKDGKVFQFRTFITYDMLKNDQETFNEEDLDSVKILNERGKLVEALSITNVIDLR